MKALKNDNGNDDRFIHHHSSLKSDDDNDEVLITGRIYKILYRTFIDNAIRGQRSEWGQPHVTTTVYIGSEHECIPLDCVAA